MLNTLKAKIIAGACAAAVVGGGVTAGVVISNNSKSKTESRPAVSASANVSKPANASTSANISSPADSSPTESTPTQSVVNEPTSFPDNPISETGEVMWDLIPTAPAGDFETSPHTPGGVLHEDEIRIKRYNGNAEYVKIPEKIDGKTVVLVAGFFINNDIKGVYFPDGVTDIEYLCFSDNKNLKYVRFPETLDRIAGKAFQNCPGLESVTLPQSTRTLMNGAFSRCENLKSVTVPDSIETMWKGPIKNSPNCELHYRGYIFKGDDLNDLELYEEELRFNGQKIPVGDLEQVLGGTTDDGASDETSTDETSD